MMMEVNNLTTIFQETITHRNIAVPRFHSEVVSLTRYNLIIITYRSIYTTSHSILQKAAGTVEPRFLHRGWYSFIMLERVLRSYYLLIKRGGEIISG